MKKIMALACAIILAIAALAACGSGNTVDPTEVPTDVTEATIAE